MGAALLDTASWLKYRFVYFPTAEGPKGIARGFLLQAYPSYLPDGQLATEGTPAEFFANENGLVLERKEFGTARERIPSAQESIPLLSRNWVCQAWLARSVNLHYPEPVVSGVFPPRPLSLVPVSIQILVNEG